MSKERQRIDLSAREIPKQWYNIQADLPEPLPEPKPGKLDLSKVMIKECLEQEVSQKRWIDIPQEVLDLYVKIGRPRPLKRAVNLEKALDTPAIMLYKAENESPTGSHKTNTAVTQAHYAKREGFETLVTETGAGQWGTALALGAALERLGCRVYWVRAVHNWKRARRELMKLLGAEVFASPSNNTEAGKRLLSVDPEHPGSLSIAITEGLEDAFHDTKAAYCLGSVLNHVLLHQTIIGLETKLQLQKEGIEPDVMISCLGGGSNFGGFVFPFVSDVLRGDTKKKIRFIAAQSEVAPNLQGEYRYNFADHEGLTPQLKMYTLGHQKEMDPIYADGLRYHGCAPIISLLRHHGFIETVAYPKDEKYVFEAVRMFVQCEGVLPAPESGYSIRRAIDEARRCKKEGKREIIVFNNSGHGFMDMEGYSKVLEL